MAGNKGGGHCDVRSVVTSVAAYSATGRDLGEGCRKKEKGRRKESGGGGSKRRKGQLISHESNDCRGKIARGNRRGI